ncbi:MAG: circadian clock protein KaiA [Synechococcales bacterium]|nr:circadian clock protein KaiA [Synechococcales bacterium]
MTSFSPRVLSSERLLVCLFTPSSDLLAKIQEILGQPQRYLLVAAQSRSEFFQLIEQERQQIDCLVLQEEPQLPSVVDWLHAHATLLPTVVVMFSPLGELADDGIPTTPEAELTFLYHTAEVRLTSERLQDLGQAIERAIGEFLNLSPACRLPTSSADPDPHTDLTTQNFLSLQQRRLTEKLKERLGYLGVYYKRSHKNFLRNLPPAEQRAFLDELKADYRSIVLAYFSDEEQLNRRLDDYVNTAFFADIPVSQVVEIHMEIMDDFAKQLKLEGRNEEILLDYRLTLIDTLAHLCEMYRRSIPRESPEQ